MEKGTEPGRDGEQRVWLTEQRSVRFTPGLYGV